MTRREATQMSYWDTGGWTVPHEVLIQAAQRKRMAGMERAMGPYHVAAFISSEVDYYVLKATDQELSKASFAGSCHPKCVRQKDFTRRTPYSQEGQFRVI